MASGGRNAEDSATHQARHSGKLPDCGLAKKLFANKTLINTFGAIAGAQLTSAPRGYAKDHPAIELLRYKQFILKHSFTDEEVLSPDFVKKANDTFKKMRPFLHHMSEVLITDANGLSLVD